MWKSARLLIRLTKNSLTPEICSASPKSIILDEIIVLEMFVWLLISGYLDSLVPLYNGDDV